MYLRCVAFVFVLHLVYDIVFVLSCIVLYSYLFLSHSLHLHFFVVSLHCIVSHRIVSYSVALQMFIVLALICLLLMRGQRPGTEA